MVERINKTTPSALTNSRLSDGFWQKRQELIWQKVLPYQWDVLNDRLEGVEPSGVIRNFRIAAGKETGHFYGRPFQDSDLYKWLEAVGYLLSQTENLTLEASADEAIELIANAQCADGYLDTLYIIERRPEQRWTNLRDDHELYCAGHLIEAAVAYFRATEKQLILDVARRLADHICKVLGPEMDQIHGYPGHEEIELALVKLYKLTGEKKYLHQASYFIEERGKKPLFFDQEAKARGDLPPYGPTMGKFTYTYNQSHLPVHAQTVAVGHAVRALYLYCGITDVAEELNDSSLRQVVKTLWDDVTGKKMYLTGAVGSSQFGEAFTIDYDLPNDTAYNETCASVALIMWAYRMLCVELDRQYADIMERALYNAVLGSMSFDGRRYFYANPLEIWPASCAARNDKQHIAAERKAWFTCACCPPNVARLLSSLPQYFYSFNDSVLCVHLYGNSKTTFITDGQRVTLSQTTEYPWDGRIHIDIDGEADFILALRLPSWCREYSLSLNQRPIDQVDDQNGYLLLSRRWHSGDCVELMLQMPIERVYPSPLLRSSAGKAAVQRGPLIYCVEEVDNGSCLSDIHLEDGSLIGECAPDFLGGIIKITAPGSRSMDIGGQLYLLKRPARKNVTLNLVPYYLWNNRGIGEMSVWILAT